jgi:hypothetical protein
LVGQGHDVTLFASEDSFTTAELVPCIPRAVRLDPDVVDPIPHFMVMLDKVRERAAEFDLLHFHIDYFQFPLFRSSRIPVLTTLHGRQDLSDHLPLYQPFFPHAARFNLARPAATAAGCKFCRECLSRATAGSSKTGPDQCRRLSGISRTHVAGKAA